ncbi:MAG TPA: nitroreductase [Erysipelotrichaceae bacterium]|nr:nitroreductase [Erysipelotrichaceae bacterium]
MNKTIQQLYERKSTRAFLKEPIAQKEKEIIFEAAMQAPSAGNMSLYSIVEISDPVLKEKLAILCDDQPFIVQAPLVLVFLADYQKWHTLFASHDLPCAGFGEGDLFLAMADCLIAAQNTVVAAESLGIGSCYIGDIIEHYEEVKELLHLPKYALPAALARSKPPRFSIQDMVFTNSYPERSDKQIEEMFMRRQDLAKGELDSYVKRIHSFKYDTDFRQEMNRSVQVMIDSWSRHDDV